MTAGIAGTRLQNDLTQHRMRQTRASLGKQEAAMMAGVKTQNYAEMSTDVSRASTYQNMADKLQSYVKNGEIISKKLFYQEKI